MQPIYLSGLEDKAAFHDQGISATHKTLRRPTARGQHSYSALTLSNEHKATRAESGEKGLVASLLVWNRSRLTEQIISTIKIPY